MCEQLAQGCYVEVEQPGVESNAQPLQYMYHARGDEIK